MNALIILSLYENEVIWLLVMYYFVNEHYNVFSPISDLHDQ
jgi:hypothetical protein